MAIFSSGKNSTNSRTLVSVFLGNKCEFEDFVIFIPILDGNGVEKGQAGN
jgi:hypothetical protein